MAKKLISGLLVMMLLALIPGSTMAGKWWDKFGKPKYGGTITFRQPMLELGIDPYIFNAGVNYAYETMIHFDWTLDRNIWSFKTTFVPSDYYIGELAESWELTDPRTFTVHLRKGIHWQNKEPVNGRGIYRR